MTELIRADGIVRDYCVEKHVVPVLHGASLSVDTGQTVAIVGKSGAGKSTLLHVLGGLDAPVSGSVSFKGRNFYKCGARERARMRAKEIGFVFQSYHLLPELNVLENTVLPAMTDSRTPIAAMRERGRALLAHVGLEERALHRPMELSGGEQQRVALARALMNDPELVLADEPTGNLDDKTGEQVLSCVFSLVRERKHSLVIVTHNERLASLCDRTLHLIDGALQE